MNQDQRNKKAEQLRLAARIIETGCEWEIERVDMGWTDSKHIQACQWGSPLDAINSGYEIRTKEPVVPVPEGWRELRDDEKQNGRWVDEAKRLVSETGEWKHSEFGGGAFTNKTQRIIVPIAKPKKRVPLGPCDVVPGSVIELVGGKEGWNAILCVDAEGITCLDRDNNPQDYTFEELMSEWFESRIKRPTDTEFQPCFKEVES